MPLYRYTYGSVWTTCVLVWIKGMDHLWVSTRTLDVGELKRANVASMHPLAYTWNAWHELVEILYIYMCACVSSYTDIYIYNYYIYLHTCVCWYMYMKIYTDYSCKNNKYAHTIHIQSYAYNIGQKIRQFLCWQHLIQVRLSRPGGLCNPSFSNTSAAMAEKPIPETEWRWNLPSNWNVLAPLYGKVNSKEVREPNKTKKHCHSPWHMNSCPPKKQQVFLVSWVDIILPFRR